MDDTTKAANAAKALGNTISNLERAALENGGVRVELRGRDVRALVRQQRSASGRQVRSVCWELDGAGISRANLLRALNGGSDPINT